MGERATFWCSTEFSRGFAQLAAILRREELRAAAELHDATHGHGSSHHSAHSHCANSPCQWGFQFQSDPVTQDLLRLGDETPLIFDFELLSYHPPGEFVKELWEMDAPERLATVVSERDRGKELFATQSYAAAASAFEKALGFLANLKSLHTLTTEQKSQTAEMDDNCLLNLSACYFKLARYLECIDLCNQILKKFPQQVKALYRRGVSYLRIGNNPELARKDLELLVRLHPTHPEVPLEDVQRELHVLASQFKVVADREKALFHGKLL